MQHRRLGSHGPEVSALGLGCMSLGMAQMYCSSIGSDSQAVELIHRALDLGVTFDGRPGAGRQGTPRRTIGSRTRHDLPRAPGASDSRATDRILALEPGAWSLEPGAWSPRSRFCRHSGIGDTESLTVCGLDRRTHSRR
jgi:hypothetical protein